MKHLTHSTLSGCRSGIMALRSSSIMSSDTRHSDGTSISYHRTSNFPSRSDTPTPTTSGSISRRSRGRPRTAASTVTGNEQQIICAISESRGISPVVGMAFVNLSTTEAVLCQISDNQTYTKTEQKLSVYFPSEILVMSTAIQPKSKLVLSIESNLPSIRIIPITRSYWAETTGNDYIQHLAIKQDIEALKVCLDGNCYAICCFSAVLKYIELGLSVSFPFYSLRIKFEPSEDCMMIDQQTCKSLEIIQNLQLPKSKDCLYGLLNQTLTPMGARRLRINMMQPSTDRELLEHRYAAVEELSTNEDVFFAVRQALKSFVDVNRVLTAVNTIPRNITIQYTEQSINNVIMLKQFVKSIPGVYEALSNTRCTLLRSIADLCSPIKFGDVEILIDNAINADITYQTSPLDLRNQRTYAVRAGVNGLLDVARQTYKEANEDVVKLINDYGNAYELTMELKYEAARGYYIRVPTYELEEHDLPSIFIYPFRKNKMVECQTLDLRKWNQKIKDAHNEVLLMSDQSIRMLIENIREDISPLFKTSDALALLDMLASFAQLVTTQDYCRPDLTTALGIVNGRHPIMEKIRPEKYIANDAYATQQSRFQIITGCNMSGKSTFIRSLALMTVMAQIGCFVPATRASLPLFHQLFARIAIDDSNQGNASSFSLEMRETAFILRNVDARSMVIIDELGRGTATRDGLCIAIAISEALIESRAFIWFVTHFQDLAKVLAERSGVVNKHMTVELEPERDRMTMMYRIADGYCQDEHYGIALAKIANLPHEVIEVAEEVSKDLKKRTEAKKRSSKTIAIARRRKLILNLREQLLLARDGKLEGEPLLIWMKKLQDEFVRRMAAIEVDLEAAEMQDAADGRDVAMDDVETVMSSSAKSGGAPIHNQDHASSELCSSRSDGDAEDVESVLPV